MRFRLLLIILLAGMNFPLKAQPDAEGAALISAYVDTMNALGDSMIQSNDVNTRIACGYAMVKRLVRALRVPGSFRYPFDSLLHISIVEPDDHAFRIYTWHIEMIHGLYRQLGAIQLPSKKELKLIPLIDGSRYMDNPMDTVLNPDFWYGAVYYKVLRKKYHGKNLYFLFGYDANDPFSNKKVVDVLTFSKGEPRFGLPVFYMDEAGDSVLYRFIIEYSNEAAVGLNYYDEFDKIIYDHLVPRNPMSEGVYSTYIPDGTYEGFEYRKGKWYWVEKVFHEAINENDNPPVPKPVDFDKEYPKR